MSSYCTCCTPFAFFLTTKQQSSGAQGGTGSRDIIYTAATDQSSLYLWVCVCLPYAILLCMCSSSEATLFWHERTRLRNRSFLPAPFVQCTLSSGAAIPTQIHPPLPSAYRTIGPPLRPYSDADGNDTKLPSRETSASPVSDRCGGVTSRGSSTLGAT